MPDVLVSVRGVRVRYADKLRARGVAGPAPSGIEDVSFDILRGETLGLVGESGSGKTTVARAVLRLLNIDAGEVRFAGVDVHAQSAELLRRLRRRMQIVFQDPFTSLNPRMRIGEIVGEGIATHGLAEGAEASRRVGRLLDEVGLDTDTAERYPRELSGGQRQRVAIARALAVDPEFLVLDEAVSALDVTTQARILELFERLRASRGLTVLFVAHNLAVVQRIATRVAVMHEGRVVELAPSFELFAAPKHAHTQALLASVLDVPAMGPGT